MLTLKSANYNEETYELLSSSIESAIDRLCSTMNCDPCNCELFDCKAYVPCKDLHKLIGYLDTLKRTSKK